MVDDGKKLIKNKKSKYQKIKIDNTKMSVLIFTSGTTNTAKGVMLSQKNITSNIASMARMSKMYDNDVLLSFLPLHHTFECTITFLYGWYSGATVAFCDGLKYIAKNLEEYKISVFVAVPLVLETIYKKIQKGIRDQGKEKLVNMMSKLANFLLIFHIDIRRKVFKSVLDQLGGNLRIAYFGAASMDKKVIEGYNNFGIDTVQGYGLTETSPLIAAETDKEHCPGSVGMAPFNVQLKLEDVDENGVGEIVAKGPNIMLGYYENPEATAAVMKDGWFHTGDLGLMDGDGNVFIKGRSKNMLLGSNGQNIYPEEIEDKLNSLPLVNECLVIQEGNKLVGLVHPDFDEAKSIGLNRDDIEKIMEQDRQQLNTLVTSYSKVSEIRIQDEEFQKTPKRSIKRYLYTK